MKLKHLAMLAVFAMLLSLFTGCNNGSTDNTGESSDDKINSEHNEFTIPVLKERTAWNIELSFIECTERGIKIKICDHDNQGFEFNDLYFVLKLYQDGKWVKISEMNENAANRDLSYVFPSKTTDFVDTNNMNFFAFLPGVELKTGHYRLTKVLRGREFSLEFDLTFD